MLYQEKSGKPDQTYHSQISTSKFATFKPASVELASIKLLLKTVVETAALGTLSFQLESSLPLPDLVVAGVPVHHVAVGSLRALHQHHLPKQPGRHHDCHRGSSAKHFR
jgi:hypothetical protein